MTYNKNIPFNDLPDLPPLNFVESPEYIRDAPAKAEERWGKDSAGNPAK